ncbi:hypothetical protein SK128_018957, partial [Halocaridina rubra]
RKIGKSRSNALDESKAFATQTDAVLVHLISLLSLPPLLTFPSLATTTRPSGSQ